MTDVASSTSPVPLHLPAILQNPTNNALRQVAAHNAQQREKSAARREACTPVSTDTSGRGKRYVRRKDNAAFAFNPHIAQPTRSDFSPPVPLHHRSIQPTFSPSAVERNASIPGSQVPVKDPFSSDSRHGAFSTSLKGTRALLRKRGRRAEDLVPLIDGKIRDWLSGNRLEGNDEHTEVGRSVIDQTMTEFDVKDSPASPETPSIMGSRRMPAQHQVRDRLPSIPLDHGRVSAVLELSRSPAHMTWAITDGFDRLVVHLVVRYYELISWSEDHLTTDNQTIRLTHIILPHLTQPRIPLKSHALVTPETSDLSAPSSSDRDTSDTDGETASDAGTEVGYSLDPDTTITLQSIPDLDGEMAELDNNELRRTASNTYSMYASSEGGGSEFSMVDSMTLPPPPSGNGGWTLVTSDTASEPGDIEPAVVRRNIALGRMGARGWEDRPSFFEYLYGE